MRAAAGYTLVELVVAMGLLGLVMGLTVQVLGPPLTLWEQSRGRADLEQRSVILETRLAAEMRASSADTVTICASPPGFSFAAFDEAAPYDPDTGKPHWTTRIAYVLDTDNQVLYRKTDAIPTPADSLLSIPDLSRLLTTENGTEQAVATFVAGLDVRAPAAAPAHVELQYAWPHAHGVENVRRVLDVRMRNG